MNKFLLLLVSLVAICSCGPANKTPVASRMDEEVNVGYGTQSRQKTGFSIDKVQVDERVVSS